MKITDTLLPEFDQEMANTRKCLARIPDDKFSYKPHPKSFDMGSLAMHIATMLDWGDHDIKPTTSITPRWAVSRTCRRWPRPTPTCWRSSTRAQRVPRRPGRRR